MGTLRIGWASRDFCTEEPTCIHGQFYLRISEGVRDPLTVTALAIGNGEDQLVMLSCDTTRIPPELLKRIRARVRETSTDIAAERIIVNATHTHTTGDLLPIMAVPYRDFPVDPSIRIMPTEAFCDLFVERAAEAVVQAWRDRAPGGVAWAYDYAVAGHNRRVCYFDDLSKRPGAVERAGMMVNGHACMYGNTADQQFSHYEGGADHMIQLLYTFDAEDRLTGAVVNVPCPSQCSENGRRLSADYWHDVRARLRAEHGAIHVLAQAAPSGDLAPRVLHYGQAQERRFRLKYGPDTPPDAAMRTDIAERIAVAFGSALSWARTDIRREASLRNDLAVMTLPRRPITDAEYTAEKASHDELMRQSFQSEGTPAERLQHDSVLAARRNRSAAILARYADCRTCPDFTLELHVAALDGIAFATSPFELYSDYMHRIQARSPFQQTFCVELVGNEYWPGSSGYLPTERALAGGGYSASRYCNQVGPQGGQMLVEETLATLNRLHGAS